MERSGGWAGFWAGYSCWQTSRCAENAASEYFLEVGRVRAHCIVGVGGGFARKELVERSLETGAVIRSREGGSRESPRRGPFPGVGRVLREAIEIIDICSYLYQNSDFAVL